MIRVVLVNSDWTKHTATVTKVGAMVTLRSE
jgi:hypothetical protein